MRLISINEKINVANEKQVTPINISQQFMSKKYFIGANLYHNTSIFRCTFHLGQNHQEVCLSVGEDFADKFIARFLNLDAFSFERKPNNKFIKKIQSEQGVHFEEVLLEAIVAIEDAIYFSKNILRNVGFTRIEQHETDSYLIWQSDIEHISRQITNIALLGLLELLPSQYHCALPSDDVASDADDFTTAFQKLQKVALRHNASPSTAVIRFAAQQQGIPCKGLDRQYLSLGQGDQQHLFYSSITSVTTCAAQKITSDKRLTQRRLTELRLPAPKQIKVLNIDAAYVAAEKIGFPIVIKPLKGNKGRGVTANIMRLEDIDNAYQQAEKASSDSPYILIERFEEGEDYRLLVINGKFVASLRRKPPIVTGDGESSVEQLIDVLNSDPWRDDFRMFQVKKDISLKQQLKKFNLTLEAVPEQDQEVLLRNISNISTGGISIDITEKVHPDNQRMAERAAIGVGLDVAGIDFMTKDITRSYREVGGAIIEINARPELCMHTWPKIGKSRNVAGEILKAFFPEGSCGRIPVIAIAGDKGTASVARVLDIILRGAGLSIGLVLRKTSYINGVYAELSESQQRKAPVYLFLDPSVNTLVTTVSPRLITQHGLLFDQATVSVIMDKRLESNSEPFYQGLSIIERATSSCFVVHAGNTFVLDQLQTLQGKRLILVSDRRNDPVIEEHLKAGHDAVVITWIDDKERIVIFSGKALVASFNMIVKGSRDGRNKTRRLKNGKMFAIAAALGSGLSGSDLIKAFKNAPLMIEENIADE